MKSPIVLLRSLWNDFQRLEPDVKGLERDFHTLEKRFENEGYGFLAVALPSLCRALDRGLSEGRFTCPLGLKPVKRGAIPRLFSGMFSEIFEPFTGRLKEAPNVGALKNLRQVLLFFKKIEMSSESDDLLDKKAASQFFQTDVTASQVIIPDRRDHLIGLVSKLCLNDLNSRDLSQATFKHGPGAIREGLSSNQKWLGLVDAIKKDGFDTVSFGYDTIGVILSDLSERTGIIQSSDLFCSSDAASRGIAKLITVPKNSTSRRTITIEPLANQFCQQGLNIALRDSISKCRILSNCLALSDQSLNQKLALEGSLHDNWATLDLASASDSLSQKLVESVFRHHGLFLDHMMDCRSPFVEYQGKVTTLGKFAGMGNALTFPVQSICFAVISIAAILDCQGFRPDFWNVRRASRHIRVYGDDIIVDTRYARQVVDWIESVGLKVNANKSFLDGNFKESCGVDAFMGIDLTPIYLKRRPDQTSTEPSAIKSIVETSNLMWFAGYYEASTALKNEVEERLGHSLPLVSLKSEALGWHTRLDSMIPHRWNPRLHRLETRAYVLTSLKKRDRLDGYAALLKFFHVPLLGRAKDHLEKTVMRFKHRIRQKWVPTCVG